MKNVLKYYYNLEPNEIHQINRLIKFSCNDKNYILYQTERNDKEIEDIYKLHIYLLLRNKYCHRIILNINTEIISRINNKSYILLETNIENRIININDILHITSFSINKSEFTNITKSNWHNMWIKKNDYIEYQISQFGKKYELIRESSDYYIGIAEICISMLNETTEIAQQLTICHNRINNKTTTDEYYNPLEFIVDKKERDIGEYLKTFNNSETIIQNIKNLKYNNILNDTELEYLFIRILYPSEYFDVYELVINNIENQIKIDLKKVVI